MNALKENIITTVLMTLILTAILWIVSSLNNGSKELSQKQVETTQIDLMTSCTKNKKE